MTKGFCPKCGQFSFGYDPLIKVYRCYSDRCEFVDIKREYGEGLTENPFSHRDSLQLENKVAHHNIGKEF